MGTTVGSAAQKVLITDRFLKALKPAPKGTRPIIWDAVTPNFGVRVSDRATKDGRAAGISFIAMKRLPGHAHPTRVTVGKYPAQSLAEARKEAGKKLGEITAGKNPAEEERERKRQEARAKKATVRALAEDFITDMRERGLRNVGEFEAIIRREFLGQVLKDRAWIDTKTEAWRELRLGSVTPGDATQLIRAIKGRGTAPGAGQRRRTSGGPWAARHALAIGTTMFGWAVDQHGAYPITASPFERLKAKKLIGELKPRQRILTDDELRVVWRAAEQMGAPYGDLVRFLLLTGQRLSPAATLQRAEINLDKAEWIAPAGKMKMDKPHVTPLSPAAVEILRPLMEGPSHRNGFLFSTSGSQKAFSGFSKAKKALDAKIEEIRRKDGGDDDDNPEPMAPWVLHDLRRTVRSGLPAFGVPDAVAEAVLAHARPGIVGVYDLYSYAAEKRDALNRWAAHVAALIKPPPANVVPLRAVG